MSNNVIFDSNNAPIKNLTEAEKKETVKYAGRLA